MDKSTGRQDPGFASTEGVESPARTGEATKRTPAKRLDAAPLPGPIAQEAPKVRFGAERLSIPPRPSARTHGPNTLPSSSYPRSILGWPDRDLCSGSGVIRILLALVLSFWSKTHDISETRESSIKTSSGSDWLCG